MIKLGKFALISGVCPVQNKKYSYEQSYASTSTLDHPNRYKKNIRTCEYDKEHCLNCDEKCPLYENAPEELEFV